MPRALVTLGDPKLQVKIFEEILEHGYSVRKVEEIVKSLNEGETVKSGDRKIVPKTRQVARRIQHAETTAFKFLQHESN